MLALRMEAVGLHPFHASAVRYRDRTVLFLGGESNHGKSMGQIEACRRGAQLVSTETTVIDEDGRAVMGSKAARSSEARPRAPSGPTRPAPQAGRRQVLRRHADAGSCTTEPSVVDVVIVPAIDGNFAPVVGADDPVRARSSRRSTRSRTTSCSTSCWRPAMPMPIVDTERAPRARADFVAALRRPAVLLRPGGHAAGAARRGRPASL